MPAEDFRPLVCHWDAELAELFGAPVEQVWARRLELAPLSRGPEPRR
jgi:hypothetical protein